MYYSIVKMINVLFLTNEQTYKQRSKNMSGEKNNPCAIIYTGALAPSTVADSTKPNMLNLVSNTSQ